VNAHLDRAELQMALVALAYYQRAHLIMGRPIPPEAEHLEQRLRTLMSADGPQKVAPVGKLLTTGQVAQRLNISQRHALRIAQKFGYRVGRQWLTPEDALALPEETV
jgi:hypothetical protein